MSSAIASPARTSGESVRVESAWSRGADLVLELREVHFGARGGQLLVPATGAAAGIGVHVELHVRVGEDRGADVAAVQDHAACASHLALAGHHLPPHRAGARRPARRPR